MSDNANATPTMYAMPGFNPSIPKKGYNQQEWIFKEEYYVQALLPLVLPIDANPGDVKMMAIGIDDLLNAARIDLAFICQKAEKYDRLQELLEKNLFVTLKQAPPVTLMKPTVDDLKGLVVQSIESNDNWNNTGMTLYDISILTNERKIFMTNIVKQLDNLASHLILHLGILKIENSLNGLLPSVPEA